MGAGFRFLGDIPLFVNPKCPSDDSHTTCKILSNKLRRKVQGLEQNYKTLGKDIKPDLNKLKQFTMVLGEKTYYHRNVNLAKMSK